MPNVNVIAAWNSALRYAKANLRTITVAIGLVAAIAYPALVDIVLLLLIKWYKLAVRLLG